MDVSIDRDRYLLRKLSLVAVVVRNRLASDEGGDRLTASEIVEGVRLDRHDFLRVLELAIRGYYNTSHLANAQPPVSDTET